MNKKNDGKSMDTSTYTNHYTFSNSRVLADENIKEDLRLGSDGNVVFVRSHYMTHNEAVDAMKEKLVDGVDAVAALVLKPTHKISKRAEALLKNHKKKLRGLVERLNAAKNHKANIINKLSAMEHKRVQKFTRVRCRECTSLVSFLFYDGCDCPVCGAKETILNSRDCEVVDRLNATISGVDGDINALLSLYDGELTELISQTDLENDYRWVGLSKS